MRTNDWGPGDVQVSGGEPGSEPAARGGAGRALTPERIAEVRRHVLEGAYGSAEVAGRVAEGILRSGHL
jgi:hypothetical protein